MTQRKEYPKVDEMTKEYFEQASEHSGGQVEHIRLVDTGHFDQCDVCMFLPLELVLMFKG